MKRCTIKKLLIACVGFVVLTTASAHATGVLIRKTLPLGRAPSYVPFFDWNGIYIGISGGYGFGRSSWTNTINNVNTGDFDVNGLVVGGAMGYNFQLGRMVYGFESDVSWTNIAGSTSANCTGTCETTNSWLGTARGRIGYAYDRVLPYITGGAAFGNIRNSVAGISPASKSQVGWTFGVGVEYAYIPNWSVKLEYLYVDLGSVQCPSSSCITTIDTTFQVNLIRAGLNYKF